MLNTLLALLALSVPPPGETGGSPLWTDLAESRPLQMQDGRGGGQRVEVVEEYITPDLKLGVTAVGRVNFPGYTDVTVDHLTYADFYDIGWGVGLEVDLLAHYGKAMAVGAYFSANWDTFDSNPFVDFFGDSIRLDDMDITSYIVGAKFLQRSSQYVSFEGRLGGGVVHYTDVDATFVVSGIQTREQFFRAITRAVFELGGRVGFGTQRICFDLGFGMRFMGPAARGKDVSNAIDPDMFYTFTMDAGLTLRF